MRRTLLARLLPLALLTLLGTRALEATSYVLVSDENLADQAHVIARAEVLDVGASTASGPITTDYRLLIHEVVKGDPPESSSARPLIAGSSIIVRMLGGELADGRGLFIWGVPRFEPGQRLFLFLGRSSDGSFHVLHLFQGAFREVEERGEILLRRSLEEALRLPSPDPSLDEPEAVRHAEGFATWLRDREQGFERPRDYLVEAPFEAELSYTLLGDVVNRRFRWFEFDTGGQIVWQRHQAGQTGLADGGAGVFAVAMKVWNDEPNTPVRYVDGGTTPSITGFAQLDGRNAILFSDLSNSIANSFSCSGGGTVAVGGVSFVRTPTRPWRGRLFEPTLEAEIVINDGVDCYFNGRPDRAEEAYAHELGHTLGLGHSCGDSASPDCSTLPEADEALMRAALHNDRRGAQLNRDDRAGLRYLYDVEFDGGVCPWIPGHPDFCRDCGPCGPAEGDCDTKAECMPTLECTPGRGPELGFDAMTDVCLAGGSGGCSREFGDRRYCRDCGPCDAGEGGCRNDRECAAGLVCEKRAGDEFGFDPKAGVCVVADPPPCPRPLGHRNYCRDCGPCRLGEGGCRRDEECGGLLVCVKDAGAELGLPPKTDVCK